MDNETPAFQIPPRDLTANVALLCDLLNQLAPYPSRIIELCGGTGNMTHYLSGRFPGVLIVTHEIDPICLVTIHSRGLDNVLVIPKSYTEVEIQMADLVVADFNLVTFIRLQDPDRIESRALRRVFKARPEYILITDSAVGKLHLNFQRYGLQSPDFGEYARLYNKLDPAYVVRGWSRSTRAAMIGLMRLI